MKRPRQSGFRRAGRWLLRAAVGLVVATIAVVASLRWVDPPVTAFMLQQSGPERRYVWTDRPGISDSAALAVVAAEDQRFLSHHGVDLVAIDKALDDAEAGGRMRGASTLTQQLAKNLFLWPGRSFVRKGAEAALSVTLDALLPKERILELYLNIVEFGPGLYGVEAASWRYFGKPARHLNDADAALLAAVLPNPRRLHAAAPSAYVRERQRWILGQMQRLRREGYAELL